MLNSIIVDKVDNWTKQMEQRDSTIIFEETPVPLDEFLYSQSFLNLPQLSPKQYDFVKHGSYIYNDAEIEQLQWEKVRRVGELVAWFGKGAGKDFCSCIIFSRIAYLLLCLNNPQKYYNQAEISSIDMLNMAYNADQAESVFFKMFSAMVDYCRWFSDKAEIKTGFIQFDKRIAAYSGHSFEEAFEGKNLIVAVLDEISAFKTKIEVEQMSLRRMRAPRYSAESVYDMAKSSVESRFGNGIGKVISLSFSRFKNDYIQQLYEKGMDEPTVYVSKGATWEVNPTKKRSDFDDEFRKNPERAESRYACNPSSVEGGYFRNKIAITQAFPIIPKEQVPTTDDICPIIKPFVKCLHNNLCSIHIDLGLKRDKAGFCMSHVARTITEMRKNPVGELIQTILPIVQMDIATSFIAPLNGEIDFSKIRQFLTDLINRKYVIGKLTSDGWQSVDFLQIVTKMGIETDTRSVDRTPDAYDCLKELIYENRLIGYSYIRNIDTGTGNIIQTNEIIDELSNLIFDGRRINHTAYGGKDLSDAVSGSVQGAIEIGLSSISASDVMVGQDREAVMAYDLGKDREYLSGVDDEYFTG